MVMDKPVNQTSFVDHIANRERKLARCEAAYSEHLKSFPREWFDYGKVDPLSKDPALTMPCSTCGRRPELDALGDRYQARCQCGASATPAKTAWLAKMHWNNSGHCTRPLWRELPYFWLSELDPDSGRERLRIMREHLELRASLAGLRRVSGQENVGGRFIQRLKAYHAWALYGLVLIKQQEPGSSNADGRVE